jgi:hypothetical protein
LNRRLRDSGILEQADRGMPQRMKTKLARHPSGRSTDSPALVILPSSKPSLR